MKQFRIAREGWLCAGELLVLCILAALLLPLLALPLACLAGFVLYFFRDPERIVQRVENAVLSPADGRVVSIDTVDDAFLGEGARRVTIFLSLFDVHVNRAPVSGRIAHLEYTPGRFVSAFKEKASLLNENNLIGIEGKNRAKVKQIAGIIARRIICSCRVDDEVSQGERIGMIKFGSRVEITFPAAGRTLVQKGDRVKAGITRLGVIE